MSNYTTGEAAKFCGVTVRTVQYYDTRGILTPSALTEGGRRLYSEADLQKLRIICFLRDLGLSIQTIGQLLEDEHSEASIDLMLQQQEDALRQELENGRRKLEQLELLRRSLKRMEAFSVETIGDVAQIMKNRKRLHRLRTFILSIGLVMDAIEIGTIWYWIKTGIWWPFAVGMAIVVALGIWISRHYFLHVSYICPVCHTVFRPTLKEAFWAAHTPTTRRLTCTDCGKKSFCVETVAEDPA